MKTCIHRLFLWTCQRCVEQEVERLMQGYRDDPSFKNIPADCYAVQYGDRTECGLCNLAWDTNDADRPACKFPSPRMRAP